MPIRPPAYCQRCRVFFPSPILIGDEARYVTYRNCATTCPRCGGMAAIGDGGVDGSGNAHFFFRDALGILSAPEVRPLLLQLKVKIQAAQANQATTEEISAKLTNDFPVFGASLAALFKQAESMGLGVLTVITAILQVIQMLSTTTTTVNNYYYTSPSVTENQEQKDLKKQPARKSGGSNNKKLNRKQRRTQQSKARRNKLNRPDTLSHD